MDQTALDIKKCFSKHVPDWPGKSMDRVVHLATFACKDGNEERVEETSEERGDKCACGCAEERVWSK